MDVDGMMTDGRVTLLSQTDGTALEIKTFDAHDVQGLTLAQTAGVRGKLPTISSRLGRHTHRKNGCATGGLTQTCTSNEWHFAVQSWEPSCISANSLPRGAADCLTSGNHACRTLAVSCLCLALTQGR